MQVGLTLFRRQCVFLMQLHINAKIIYNSHETLKDSAFGNTVGLFRAIGICPASHLNLKQVKLVKVLDVLSEQTGYTFVDIPVTFQDMHLMNLPRTM